VFPWIQQGKIVEHITTFNRGFILLWEIHDFSWYTISKQLIYIGSELGQSHSIQSNYVDNLALDNLALDPPTYYL
jgi:hypothetical protein